MTESESKWKLSAVLVTSCTALYLSSNFSVDSVFESDCDGDVGTSNANVLVFRSARPPQFCDWEQNCRLLKALMSPSLQVPPRFKPAYQSVQCGGGALTAGSAANTGVPINPMAATR